jgi:hypothetical protein
VAIAALGLAFPQGRFGAFTWSAPTLGPASPWGEVQSCRVAHTSSGSGLPVRPGLVLPHGGFSYGFASF